MTQSAATRAQPDAGATFAIGGLYRVSNPLSRYDQMTGTILRITGNFALLRLTAWGTSHVVALADLVTVERGGR